MPTPKLGPGSRPLYAALRALTPREDDPCKVPGCHEPCLTDDCCREHSLNKAIGHTTMRILPNDGVIDWLAIDLAAEGSRPVALSWIEFEIALATILANGHSEKEAARRMRLPVFPRTPSRRTRIRQMADAIRQERANA